MNYACKCSVIRAQIDAQTVKLLWVFGALFAIAFAYSFLFVPHVHAQELPTADQLHTTVTDWTAAIDAVQRAWNSLGWLWPILAALPALSKRIQTVPVVGPALNAIAFNWGKAKNA